MGPSDTISQARADSQMSYRTASSGVSIPKAGGTPVMHPACIPPQFHHVLPHWDFNHPSHSPGPSAQSAAAQSSAVGQSASSATPSVQVSEGDG